MEFCKSLGIFAADGGLVYPIKRNGILPFQLCSEAQQISIIRELAGVWPFLNDEFIRKNWPGGNDVFYVSTDSTSNDVIGCVAVDRINFLPTISNLFVCPSFRKRGKATQLLEHAEIFIDILGFSSVSLWCDSELVDFYLKFGFIKGDVLNGKIILKKEI